MSLVKFPMTSRLGGALLTVAMAMLVLWSGGCQSKPPDPMTKNINTFQQLKQQLIDANKQVGNTLTALTEYSQKPGLETYTKFVDQIEGTQRQADNIRNTAAVMQDQGEMYFSNWDAELSFMTNADLKERSAEQKASVQQAYHQISAQAPALRTAYDKFMSDLRNLQTFFDRDKTPAGVASASSLIGSTNANGLELQRQIDQETANVNQVYSLFSAMKKG